jgi:hypothetical protein
MYSPIKTIIKNKSSRHFTFNADGVSFAIARGDKMELNGDLFTYVKRDGDAEALLNNIINGLIEITYAVNSRFSVVSGMNVTLATATARQQRLLDKMIGVVPEKKAAKGAKKDSKKVEEEKKTEPADESPKVNSAVPVDGADTAAKGLATEGPKEAVPTDTAYNGMFVQPADKKEDVKTDPGLGESIVVTEAAPVVAENAEVKAAIKETPIADKKATRNRVK